MLVTKNTLLELEKGFWNAAGGDGSFYKEHFATDGIMLLPFKGGILGKPAIIKTVVDAQPWKSFEIKDPQLLQIAEGNFILLYSAAGVREGTEDYHALISSQYVYNQAGWRLIFHQQTPIG